MTPSGRPRTPGSIGCRSEDGRQQSAGRKCYGDGTGCGRSPASETASPAQSASARAPPLINQAHRAKKSTKARGCSRLEVDARVHV